MDFPSAIPELVIFVVIDSAYLCSALRSVAHVSKEVSKIYPFFTDGDSTASIIRIRSIPWIEAPRHHPMPGTVSAGVFPFYSTTFIRTRKLTFHLIFGKSRELHLSFLGMMSAPECSNLPFYELSGVPKCMLVTSATRLAFDGGFVLFRQRDSLFSLADIAPSTLSHVKIMSGAFAEWRTWIPDFSVPTAFTSGLTLYSRLPWLELASTDLGLYFRSIHRYFRGMTNSILLFFCEWLPFLSLVFSAFTPRFAIVDYYRSFCVSFALASRFAFTHNLSTPYNLTEVKEIS